MPDPAIISYFKGAKNKLLLLDYDGTLTDFTDQPDLAVPSTKVLELLRRYSSMSQTRMIIVTGRGSAFVDQWFQDLDLEIIAEHGEAIRRGRSWHRPFPDAGTWKVDIMKVMSEFCLKCPGSFIEEKPSAVVWHYRRCDEDQGDIWASQLSYKLGSVTDFLELKTTSGNKVVEVTRKFINKGAAVKSFLNLSDFDFILGIGDDQSDEDLFAAINNFKHAFSIKVGTGPTCAKYRIGSVAQVIEWLNQLTGAYAAPPN